MSLFLLVLMHFFFYLRFKFDVSKLMQTKQLNVSGIKAELKARVGRPQTS